MQAQFSKEIRETLDNCGSAFLFVAKTPYRMMAGEFATSEGMAKDLTKFVGLISAGWSPEKAFRDTFKKRVENVQSKRDSEPAGSGETV